MVVLKRIFSTFLVCIFSSTAFAETRPSESELSEIFELCLQMPADENHLANKLITMGWMRSSDNQIAFEVLYSLKFLQSFRANDLDYTFKNAEFMAGSILGNSALKGTQPGFSKGTVRLAIIGVRQGFPQCGLSGPKWLAGVAKRKWGLALDLENSTATSSTDFSKDKNFGAGIINKERLPIGNSNIPKADISRNERFVEQILGEAVVFIISNRMQK